MIPPSMPERVSRVIEQKSPITKRGVMTEMPGCTLNQINKALSVLTYAGSARFDHDTKRWKHIARYQGQDWLRQSEIDAVYHACTGQRKKAIDAESGIRPERVKAILALLRVENRIHYTETGWQQTNPPPIESSVSKKPKSAITDADLAWQQYWSPKNRQQRRINAQFGMPPPCF